MLFNDFSTWVEEYEIAKQEGLNSISSTLLLLNEYIPTYKSICELVNKIRIKKENVMNEVNINIKEKAYVGLFANKCPS